MIGRPLAVVIDVRTRDFDVDTFTREWDALEKRRDILPRLVFLDSTDEILQRRYTETRRRHPLAIDRTVADGIIHERRLLGPIKDRANLVLDTSDQTIHDLKRILIGHFSNDDHDTLSVFVRSFSFRKGVPRDADLVFDVRFLTNPHYDPALRPLTGRDPAVQAAVGADPDFDEFFSGLTGLLAPLLPRYRREGKSYLTIAVGCTGGKHRSVFVAERLAAWLTRAGHRVDLGHRDLAAALAGQ